MSELVAHEWRLAVALRVPEERRGAARASPRMASLRGSGGIVRLPDLATHARACSPDGRPRRLLSRRDRRAPGRALADTGGLLELADLAEHASRWVEPISAEYRGCRLYEMPPSDAGTDRAARARDALPLRRRGARARLAGSAPPPHRGGQARLRRPERLHRRSRARRGAGRGAARPGVRAPSRRADRSGPRASRSSRPASRAEAATPYT